MAKVETRVAKSSKADKALWASKGITLESAKEKLSYSFVDLSETKLVQEVNAAIEQIVAHAKSKVSNLLPAELAPNLVAAMDVFGSKAKAIFTGVTIQAEAARSLSGLEFAPRAAAEVGEETEEVNVEL